MLNPRMMKSLPDLLREKEADISERESGWGEAERLGAGASREAVPALPSPSLSSTCTPRGGSAV